MLPNNTVLPRVIQKALFQGSFLVPPAPVPQRDPGSPSSAPGAGPASRSSHLPRVHGLPSPGGYAAGTKPPGSGGPNAAVRRAARVPPRALYADESQGRLEPGRWR